MGEKYRNIYGLFMPFRASGIFKNFNRFFTYLDKERMMTYAIDFIKHSKIKGDYCEYGVWDGYNFRFVLEYFKDNTRTYRAFDSFKGLPKLSDKEKENTTFKEGDYSYPFNKFLRNVNHRRFGNLIKTYPGWFKDTLKHDDYYKISIALIDCDIASSAREVLNHLTSRIQKGTILIFDDWYCYAGQPNQGVASEFYKWTEKNNIKYVHFKDYYWSGRSFIIVSEGGEKN